jgi:hypothetical protein
MSHLPLTQEQSSDATQPQTASQHNHQLQQTVCFGTITDQSPRLPAQLPECATDDSRLSKIQKALDTPQVSFGAGLSAAETKQQQKKETSAAVRSPHSAAANTTAMSGRSLPLLLLVCALACTASAKAAGRAQGCMHLQAETHL